MSDEFNPYDVLLQGERARAFIDAFRSLGTSYRRNHWYLRARRNGYNRNRFIDEDPFVWARSRYVRLLRWRKARS